jgi:hypothetical protein
MYFSSERNLKLLKINDNFASLRKINEDGSYEFEFRYSISQTEAIKKSTISVNVTVYYDNSTVNNSKDKYFQVKNEKIHNILTGFSNQKLNIKNQDNTTVFSTNSDISAFIDNSYVSEVLRSKSIKKTQSKLVLKNVGLLKKNRQNIRHLQQVLIKEDQLQQKSVQKSNKKLCHSLLFEHCIDPSEIKELSSYVIDPYQLSQGVLSPRNNRRPQVLTELYDQFVLGGISKFDESSTSDSSYVVTLDNVEADQLEIPVNATFKLPKNTSVQNSLNLFVKFELIDVSNNVPTETIVKELNVLKYDISYWKPDDAPEVTVDYIDRSNALINIKQIAKNANFVNVYKKSLSDVLNPDEYSFVQRLNLEQGQSVSLNVLSSESPTIYRVISAHNNLLSDKFKNVVICSQLTNVTRQISITSVSTESGVMLEARNLPFDAIELQFLKKNLSQFDSKFDTINEKRFLIKQEDDLIVENLINSELNEGDIYEFSARVYFSNGSSIDTGSEIIEYAKNSSTNYLNMLIENVIIDGDDDVKFNVKFSPTESGIDQIKNILKSQGNISFFEKNIASQKDELQKLLAYSVQRINLTTGDREDFGIITKGFFSDRGLRNSAGIKKLNPKNNYRYVITAFVRDTTTVLSSYKEKKTDPLTNKSYLYRPAKFLQPYTLKTGTIISESTNLSYVNGKSVFEQGDSGITSKLDVTFNKKKFEVKNASVSRFDLSTLLIKCNYVNNLSDVDHFVISKEILGIRSIITCIHSQFENGLVFHYKLSTDDLGYVKFVITPVLKDYSLSKESTTNEILIEAL